MKPPLARLRTLAARAAGQDSKLMTIRTRLTIWYSLMLTVILLIVFGVIVSVSYIHPHAQHSDMLILSFGLATVAAILASMALGMWVSDRLIGPIERITRTAASIVNANDLSTRISYDGPMDEIGHLAEVFNQTMARLEQLFSVQQRFVGDVSHELRTPLTSILGNLELMKRYGYDQESLEAVYREADRMRRMVNDLLLLARADNGELKVVRQSMMLDALVLEVYEEAHVLAAKRQLKILLGKLEDLPIEGDSDRLKQLLLNLVNNAIKFTPDGGTIKLEAYQQAGRALLVVSDTGIGISEADQKRIYDRFFQADHSRVHREGHDGAGLGLSIVRWIVQAHDGQIQVNSALGQGTTFTVSLPLDRRERGDKGDSKAEKRRTTQESV